VAGKIWPENGNMAMMISPLDIFTPSSLIYLDYLPFTFSEVNRWIQFNLDFGVVAFRSQKGLKREEILERKVSSYQLVKEQGTQVDRSLEAERRDADTLF
jgi:hypothetical protein